ncbi:hypothetical protein ACFYM0_37930 [Streptomyces sp. NPDC006487]|uniref:hypothetical protein n=1 Tax=Streptomyces sp. NPDC006487 TaxID=3364748 RepID=UPI0036A403FB
MPCVLVVEDDSGIRTSPIEILTEIGHAVRGATDGFGALREVTRTGIHRPFTGGLDDVLYATNGASVRPGQGELPFDEPVDLTRLVPHNGTRDAFKSLDRAGELEIEYFNAKWVMVRIVRAFGDRPGDMVAVSEIEFFSTLRGYLS